MSKTALAIIALIIGFALGAGAGVVGLLWATGNIAPSTNVAEAVPTLSLDDPTPTPGLVSVLGTEIADLNDKVDNLSSQIEGISGDTQLIRTQMAMDMNNSATLAAQPTAIPPTPVPTEVPAQAVPDRALYRISSEESEARFRINEILMGNPTEVIGVTSSVAGDFIVNFSDPPASQLGEIAINARTLKTDTEFRDQSIRGQILQTSTHEFIRFVPTEFLALTGDPVSVGDTIAFDIVGDLTIKGTTNTVTFNASVTIDSEDTISGFASTEVLYADYGINIQAPPSVSGIEDNVILEIEFVANQVDE